MIENAKIGAVIRKVFPMNLSGRELKVLITIMFWTNSFGYCDLINDELAEKSNSSKRTISDVVSSLEEKKIISVVQNNHKHRRLIYVRHLVEKSIKFEKEPPIEQMSPAQRMFKEAFPNKVVDCEVPANVDMPKLIQEIAASQFLLNHAKNMTLYSYCIKYYKLIMSGHYTDSAFLHDQNGNIIRRKKFETEREYTNLEMALLYQDPETVEV